MIPLENENFEILRSFVPFRSHSNQLIQELQRRSQVHETLNDRFNNIFGISVVELIIKSKFYMLP